MWHHLWSSEFSPTCRQNTFDCGCVDVSFANYQERKRQARIDSACEAMGQREKETRTESGDERGCRLGDQHVQGKADTGALETRDG